MYISTQQSDWRQIIYCGIENQQIDFKAAQDWNEIGRSGRAKFARHAMALANTSGGYIVIGVGEDANGNPTLYTGMDEKQASSFDPSSVGQTINRYADPAVEFDLVKPVLDEKLYVVLVVYPFKNLPHICNDVCDDELQRGVFYIRTTDARSRAAYRSSELHSIIQRALRNQRQLLGRMLRGILYEDRQAADPNAGEQFTDLLQSAGNNARLYLGNKITREKPVFEAAVHLQQRRKLLSLTDWRRQMDSLERPSLHNFPWPLPNPQEQVIYASNNSLRVHPKDAAAPQKYFLELFPDGLFYCAVLLPELPGPAIAGKPLAQLCAIFLAMAGELFTQVGLGSELLTLFFSLNNTLELHLLPNGQNNQLQYRCHIHDIRIIGKTRTAGDLEGGAAASTAAQVYQEICERFNYSQNDGQARATANALLNFLSP